MAVAKKPAAATKPAAEKKPAATKKPAAAAGEKKPNALQTPLKPSKELGAVIGTGTVTRGEMVSKIWEYIKKNNLQNPQNKREIMADDKLEPIFGKKSVTMFEMNKHLSKHLSK